MFHMKLICVNQEKSYEKKFLLTSSKGFTLIELILALSIFSILIVSFYSILSISLKSGEKVELEDEIIQNGKYAFNYIIREIRTGDEIIASNKFKGLERKYPVNLGFVIKRKTDDNKYIYITYYHYLDKIRRCAIELKGEEYPDGYLFQGHNTIAEYIYSINNTDINFDNKIITLNFQLGIDEDKLINFKNDIYVRCPVIY